MNSEHTSETGKSATDPVFKQVMTSFFQGWDKEKSRKIIEEIVRDEWLEHIQYAFLLNPDITEAVTMANRFRLPRRNMELIAQYLGRDLVQFISPEDRIRDLTPEQQLQGLDVEQWRQGLSLEDIL